MASPGPHAKLSVSQKSEPERTRLVYQVFQGQSQRRPTSAVCSPLAGRPVRSATRCEYVGHGFKDSQPAAQMPESAFRRGRLLNNEWQVPSRKRSRIWDEPGVHQRVDSCGPQKTVEFMGKQRTTKRLHVECSGRPVTTVHRPTRRPYAGWGVVKRAPLDERSTGTRYVLSTALV